jgi:hypothetical protein
MFIAASIRPPSNAFRRLRHYRSRHIIMNMPTTNSM